MIHVFVKQTKQYTMVDEQPPYRVIPARYCVGDQVVVQPSSDGSGFRTKACRLAGNMGRWTHRCGGYVMTRYRANMFMQMFAEGWTGGIFGGFYSPDNKEFKTLHEVKRHRKLIATSKV